jgi:hypothetical protein
MNWLAVAMEASERAHVRIFWSKGSVSGKLGSMYVMDFVIRRYLSVNARILLNSLVRNGIAFLSAGVLAATPRVSCDRPVLGSESGITDRFKIVARQSLWNYLRLPP